MDYERPPAVVHHPVPLPPQPAPLAPIQPATAPGLSSVQLPDGRVVTGYTLAPNPLPAPVPASVEPRPVISRTAANIALGGIGFGAICGGLVLLTTFIAALAALIQQLIILAAVIFGGWIAAQVLRHRPARSGTTVNIRKAVIKRNHFHT
ncbi:hypothetical protein [Streptomyces buecherae]|uniref:hypothetical protein n=1 Tax=Streptomyces buecherae TaxID=2763006 RepID=UPI001C25E9FA|nr:hypothetical protein [Streptomyces buecherae]